MIETVTLKTGKAGNGKPLKLTRTGRALAIYLDGELYSSFSDYDAAVRAFNWHAS